MKALALPLRALSHRRGFERRNIEATSALGVGEKMYKKNKCEGWWHCERIIGEHPKANSLILSRSKFIILRYINSRYFHDFGSEGRC